MPPRDSTSPVLTYCSVGPDVVYRLNGAVVYSGLPELMSPDVLVTRIAQRAGISHAEAGNLYAKRIQAPLLKVGDRYRITGPTSPGIYSINGVYAIAFIHPDGSGYFSAKWAPRPTRVGRAGFGNNIHDLLAQGHKFDLMEAKSQASEFRRRA